MQIEAELISNYQVELKILTTNCNIICETCRKPTSNTHLRAQCNQDVRCGEIKEKLLQQSKTISFAEAVSTASAIESSKAESLEIPQTSNRS